MRRFVAAVISAVMIFSFCGCAQQLPDGYQQVKSAKEKYETLDSGRAVMTDLTTGEEIMRFSFMVNKNDEMVFSYYGKDGEDETYAYSNGAEYFYKDVGDEMWSVISSADENYIFNIYNRENRYPYADGGIFFLDPSSVEEAFISAESDSTVIKYVYNTEKLNASTQGILTDVGGFGALTTVFEIDSEGYITSFTETGTVTDSEGVTRDINMEISVIDMNEVYDIPYPVDQLKKS